MSPTTTTATRRPRTIGARQVLALVLVLLIGCGVWAHFALKPAQAQAQEYQWLATHGLHENDPVAELGWQYPSGAARSVIVTSSTGVQAFVDLKGSRELVTTTGQRIAVVLDQRESPAGGTGVAPDLIGRSFTGDYARAAGPPAVLAVLVLLTGAGWGLAPTPADQVPAAKLTPVLTRPSACRHPSTPVTPDPATPSPGRSWGCSRYRLRAR